MPRPTESVSALYTGIFVSRPTLITASSADTTVLSSGMPIASALPASCRAALSTSPDFGAAASMTWKPLADANGSSAATMDTELVSPGL